MMKANGSSKHQITHLGAASFAPSFFPSGKRIIFSSNQGSTGGMGNFELYVVNTNGKHLEQITYSPGFDGFPVFSPDGKKLVWASNRNANAPHETNIFIADWAP
jgi:Tol biopolymer transport system component